MSQTKISQRNFNIVMNSVVQKLDQIVQLEDDAVMLAHLEEIIARKKDMMYQREKENYESLNEAELKIVKELIVRAYKYSDRGLKSEALNLLKKASAILPDHARLKERIVQLSRKTD